MRKNVKAEILKRAIDTLETMREAKKNNFLNRFKETPYAEVTFRLDLEILDKKEYNEYMPIVNAIDGLRFFFYKGDLDDTHLLNPALCKRMVAGLCKAETMSLWGEVEAWLEENATIADSNLCTAKGKKFSEIFPEEHKLAQLARDMTKLFGSLHSKKVDVSNEKLSEHLENTIFSNLGNNANTGKTIENVDDNLGSETQSNH